MDVFVERFLDAIIPHAGILRAIAEIHIFSPMIALEAASLAFFGCSTRDPRIEALGVALRTLQEALRDPERSRAVSTLVTVTLLMAFERIQRTSQDAVTAHGLGAASLLHYRGAENHMYGVEHLLFTELRPYWVSLPSILLARGK
jgi:hypothetical protein